MLLLGALLLLVLLSSGLLLLLLGALLLLVLLSFGLLLLLLGALLLLVLLSSGLLLLLLSALLLLVLLSSGLLLFLLALLLLFRLSLLLLFRGLGILSVLVVLRIHGSKGSEREEQNSRTDKSSWFHECYLHHCNVVCHLLIVFGQFLFGIRLVRSNIGNFLSSCVAQFPSYISAAKA